MKLSIVSALVSTLLLAGSAPALAQCPAAWANAYYTPNMLTPGVCPFTPNTVPSGCIRGVAYTASMCPGHYPRSVHIPLHVWAPAVNEWLAHLGGRRPTPPNRPTLPAVASASGNNELSSGGTVQTSGAGMVTSASAGASSSDGGNVAGAVSQVTAPPDPDSNEQLGWFPGSVMITALQTPPSTAAQARTSSSATDALSRAAKSSSPPGSVVGANTRVSRQYPGSVGANQVLDGLLGSAGSSPPSLPQIPLPPSQDSQSVQTNTGVGSADTLGTSVAASMPPQAQQPAVSQQNVYAQTQPGAGGQGGPVGNQQAQVQSQQTQTQTQQQSSPVCSVPRDARPRFATFLAVVHAVAQILKINQV